MPDTTASIEQKSNAKARSLSPPRADSKADGPVIDMEIFEQILELDDDDEHEFSKAMVDDYFNQADEAFKELDDFLRAKDLAELSHKGHFLKGSSAALGLVKVKKSCECIEVYGKLKDEKDATLTSEDALRLIDGRVKQAKVEFAEAKQALAKVLKFDAAA